METRSIAIGLIAVVAAFAAAFGMAKSGGSNTETAGAGVKAKSIQVAAPAAVSGVEVGGTLPALKAERKAPAKKKKSTSTSNTSTPSTSNTTTPSVTPSPSTTNTQTQTQTQPQTQSKPQASKPKAEQPAQSGGEDG
jgi:hypothetical protein